MGKLLQTGHGKWFDLIWCFQAFKECWVKKMVAEQDSILVLFSSFFLAELLVIW